MVALARFLLARGVAVGDRVGVMLPNCAAVLEAHYAVAGGCKACVLNLNQRLAPVEVRAIEAGRQAGRRTPGQADKVDSRTDSHTHRQRHTRYRHTHTHTHTETSTSTHTNIGTGTQT